MKKYMFNVKQLKMSKFIKYVWQLIISTSNVTFEVPSLRSWLSSNLQSNYFRNKFTWLLLNLSLTYVHKRKTVVQQTFACSRSTIQKLDKLCDVHKVYNKDNGGRLIDVVLVSLLLTLNIFYTLF